MEVAIYAFIRDEGSVVVFAGTDVETGRDVYIGVDHRPAQAIVGALDFEDPLVEVEPWQVIGFLKAPAELTQLRSVR